ncbi:MAG TPA: serine/threonine-protein kinase, partial [Tepidisphaeraceae bacterium]|nr:serine/threonine-protein kinase [Tepidisphaeraceae bacterium]
MSSRIAEESTAAPSNGTKPTPSWQGKRVGRFRLLSELGRGAMGRVFRAEDTLLQRHVALKVLPKTLKRGGRTITVERLISEARAAATLEHPHAVNVYEINESGGVFYIAMELLEGGSLRDIVKAAGPIDATRACLMCADAASALAQAHELGIIHRDVKPANLMLTRSGRCKLADFGLARMDDATDLSSALPESVGTPQFIAPELLKGVPASPRSDIYSLGATLWYLLTGHPPFEAETAAELLRKHLDEPLPDLANLRPDLPPGLIQAVTRAMAKQPAERFENASQFEKVLRIYTIPTESTSATSLSAIMSVPDAVVDEHQVVPVSRKFEIPRIAVIGGAGVGGLLVLLTLLLAIKALWSTHDAAANSVRTTNAGTTAVVPAASPAA